MDTPQPHQTPRPIAVLGAGGRAGRALVAEARARDLPVRAVVRDPTRHPDLARSGVSVVAGDAVDADAVARCAAGCAAIVSAVTPFSAPPDSFEGFDTGYYERVADAVLAGSARARVPRIIVIGLFATLRTPAGDRVHDDPTRFPPELRPFALSHVRGLDRLGERGSRTDWLELAPPARLSEDTAAGDGYLLGTATLDPEHADRPLSYDGLARAVLDQIERPTRSHELVAVYGT